MVDPSEATDALTESPEVRIHMSWGDDKPDCHSSGLQRNGRKPNEQVNVNGNAPSGSVRTAANSGTLPAVNVCLAAKTDEKVEDLPIGSKVSGMGGSCVPPLLSPLDSARARVLLSPAWTMTANVPAAGIAASVASTNSAVLEWEQSLRHPSTGKNPLVSMFKTPKNTLIQIIRAGMAKAQLTGWQTVLLAVMAGAYISMGGALAVTIAGMLGNTDTAYRSVMQRIATAGLFPVGLFLIIICGAELFTGNVMCLAAAMIAKKISLRELLRNWVLSYLGNYIGCVAFAFLFICSTTTGLENPAPNAAFLSSLLTAKTSQGWGSVLLRGIACNWLVCLAVWMAACAEDLSGKLIAVWWPIMTFVAIGFEHSVANMFYLMLALMDGGAGGTVNFGQTLAWNLIPVTIGNIIGGLFFIGAQVLLFGPYFSAEFLEVKSAQKKAGGSTPAAKNQPSGSSTVTVPDAIRSSKSNDSTGTVLRATTATIQSCDEVASSVEEGSAAPAGPSAHHLRIIPV